LIGQRHFANRPSLDFLRKRIRHPPAPGNMYVCRSLKLPLPSQEIAPSSLARLSLEIIHARDKGVKDRLFKR